MIETWQRNVLLHDKANHSQHRGSAVLDFGFSQVLNVEIIGETKGIEFGVSNVPIQVLGFGQEGNGFGHFGIEGSANRSGLLVHKTIVLKDSG